MHARPVRWALAVTIMASLLGLPTPEATHSADPARYAGIEDDDPNPLPKYASPEDRQLLDQLLAEEPLQAQLLEVLEGPPSGVLWTPAEYEEMAGVLVRWGSYNALLTEFVAEVSQPDTGCEGMGSGRELQPAIERLFHPGSLRRGHEQCRVHHLRWRQRLDSRLWPALHV